jgi:hypothetical protein
MSNRFLKTHVVRLTAAAACALATASCGGDLLRSGRGPVILVVESLQAASGSDPGTFQTPLLSDVQVLVETDVNGQTVRVPTLFNDLGRASLRAEMKAQGTTLNPVAPTALNAVTITRYRVNFRRADGRNTPGVDVPFGFDGAATATVQPGGAGEVVFDLVRHTNKLEPPLRNLVGLGGLMFINTIAEITFFGRDQNGNEVTATAMLDVIFADFGDEE